MGIRVDRDICMIKKNTRVSSIRLILIEFYLTRKDCRFVTWTLNKIKELPSLCVRRGTGSLMDRRVMRVMNVTASLENASIFTVSVRLESVEEPSM